MPTLLRYLVCMLTAALLCACGDAGGSGASADRPRHVLLISIDTLRPDHLGSYGYARPTSPFLDDLATRGALFEQAYATSPWTLPSHATMLTGLYPSHHGAFAAHHSLPERITPLSMMLAPHGYQSAAVVNSYHMATYALDRGFGYFKYIQEVAAQREPSGVTDEAIAWFESQHDADKPWLVFLHYYDVHSDYASLPEYEAMFVEPYDGYIFGSTRQLMDVRRGNLKLKDADVAHLRNLYDAGIRQQDDQLKKLFAYLEAHDLLRDTLVIITSDHGEEFMEHGGILHGQTQYEEVVRIPLIVLGPGIPAGVRIATPVSLIDLVPTCLALLDIDTEHPADGVNLAPLWQGAMIADRPLYFEADHQYDFDLEVDVPGVNRAARLGRFKLHYDLHREHAQLFDLASDPGEQRDVQARHATERDDLLDRLTGFLAGAITNRPSTKPLSAQDRRLLESLGYLGGGDEKAD